MKRVLFFIAFLTFSFLVTAQTSDKKKALQEKYTTYLKQNGFDCMIDSDGDVEFYHKDETLYLVVGEDENYVQLVLFKNLDIPTATESIKFINICNEVSKAQKVTKAYIQNDQIWISTELLFGSSEQFGQVFPKALDLTMSGLVTFQDLYAER